MRQGENRPMDNTGNKKGLALRQRRSTRTRAVHREWRGWAGDSEPWQSLGFWPTCDRTLRV